MVRVNRHAHMPDQLQQKEKNRDQIRKVQSAAWEGASKGGGAAPDTRMKTAGAESAGEVTSTPILERSPGMAEGGTGSLLAGEIWQHVGLCPAP